MYDSNYECTYMAILIITSHWCFQQTFKYLHPSPITLPLVEPSKNSPTPTNKELTQFTVKPASRAKSQCSTVNFANSLFVGVMFLFPFDMN